MKRLVHSTIVMTCFSFAVILFQISCQDEVIAQSGTTVSDRFLYIHYNDNTDATEFWTAKNDGTDKKKIPITLPSELKIAGPSGRLTPDGQKLIFAAKNIVNTKFIYSISITGTELTKLIDGTGITGDGVVFEVVQTY